MGTSQRGSLSTCFNPLSSRPVWSMGLRPAQGDENGFYSVTALHGSVALPFVIPSAPRISYYAAPERATCAAFIEESRMKFAGHTKLDRKIRGSRGICSSADPSWKYSFDRADPDFLLRSTASGRVCGFP
jgi:hypothetical protein